MVLLGVETSQARGRVSDSMAPGAWRRGTVRVSGIRLAAVLACVALGGACVAYALVAGGADEVEFVAFFGGLAMAALAFAVRNAFRGENGSAVAWAGVALPIAILLTFLSLHFVGPGRILGTTQCDVMAGDCGPQPRWHWVPFGLFVVTDAVLIAVMRIGARRYGEGMGLR